MVHVNVIDRGLFEVTYGSGAIQYFDQETFDQCFQKLSLIKTELSAEELSEAPVG